MNDNSVILKNDDISIVLCGKAGQGIKTIEHLLTRVLKFSGYNVFATREYMSRIRGGSNSTEIRVSSKRVAAYTDKIDILIPINPDALKHLKNRISKDTVVLGEKEQIEDIDEDYQLIDIPISDISTRLGSKIYSNMVAAGVISGIFNLESKVVSKYIEDFFVSKGKNIIKRNLEAIKLGYKLGKDIMKSGKLKIETLSNRQIIKEILLNGAEAIALGAIAGGCNFVSFYPMSPSTGIAAQIAQYSKEFDIIVEQAEDEISAINMAIGAWYAVARAYVGDSEKTKAIMKKAISHKGYALVDILQPCVVYNKMNTYKWFAENTYYLEKSYEPTNRVEAFERAIEKESMPLGIFYSNTNKPTFEENLSVYHVNKVPLHKRKREYKKLQKIIDSKRVS